MKFLKFDFDFVIKHFFFMNFDLIFFNKIDFFIFDINRLRLIILDI